MLKNIGFILSLFFISSAAVWGQATSDVYYQWGNKLYGQGNYDLCIKYYKAAIQVDPQNWKAYQALGSCEYHLGQTDNAIRDYNQSLAINPNNAQLQNFVNKISNSPAIPSAPASHSQPEPARYTQYKRRIGALPQEGSITWNLMVAADLDGYDDFTNYYGSVSGANSPVGAEFGLGADYTISPSFQLGLNFELMDKVTDPVDYYFTYGTFSYPAVDQWQDICLGPAVDAKYLIPLSNEFTFIIRGEAGYYFLTGSSLTTEVNNAYGTTLDTITTDFNSSSIGGLIGIEVEWMRGPGWAVDLGLGYRFLSFSTLNATQSDTFGLPAFNGSGVLKNGSNPSTNASMDFSGFNLTSAIRFF